MAMILPPEQQAQLSDLEVEALFKEAREIERRRRRRRRLAGASAVAAVALLAGIGFGISGGGGQASVARHASGGAGLPASHSRQRQIFTETATGSVCMPASQPAIAGDPPPGQCVAILPNGDRYQCPIGVEVTQAASNSACHRVAPPMIPAAWRPMIVRMNRVKACLQRAGLTVGGSAVPPSLRRAHSGTPVAALMIVHSHARPATVSFYLTTGESMQAYKRFLSTVERQGQGMARRGRVLYTWNDQPASQATLERGCVEAG